MSSIVKPARLRLSFRRSEPAHNPIDRWDHSQPTAMLRTLPIGVSTQFFRLSSQTFMQHRRRNRQTRQKKYLM